MSISESPRSCSKPPLPEDLRGADLRGADLARVGFDRQDLTGADLTGARLAGADLSWCQLQDVTLADADLTGADLLGADLRGANLQGCRAERAGFGGADLRGASLFQADLRDSTLTQAQLDGADLRLVNLEGARMREASLAGADLSQARLVEVDLEHSRVDGAHFDEANLRGATLKRLDSAPTATWIGADIRDVDFTGAYLLRRHIMDENYLHEFRRQSALHAWIYRLWWLTSDCGRSTARWGGWIAVIALLFSGLYLLVDIDYGDYHTAFSPFYFSFITLTTLGYGDVVPASAAAQVLTTIEVILGYVALGGLLSILANKLGRRAD